MMVPTVCCSISLLFFRRIEHLLLPVNNSLLLIRPKAMSHQHLQNNPGLEHICKFAGGNHFWSDSTSETAINVCTVSSYSHKIYSIFFVNV